MGEEDGIIETQSSEDLTVPNRLKSRLKSRNSEQATFKIRKVPTSLYESQDQQQPQVKDQVNAQEFQHLTGHNRLSKDNYAHAIGQKKLFPEWKGRVPRTR